MYSLPMTTVLIAAGLLLVCLAGFLRFSGGAGGGKLRFLAALGAAVFLVGLILHLSQPPVPGKGNQAPPAPVERKS